MARKTAPKANKEPEIEKFDMGFGISDSDDYISDSVPPITDEEIASKSELASVPIAALAPDMPKIDLPDMSVPDFAPQPLQPKTQAEIDADARVQYALDHPPTFEVPHDEKGEPVFDPRVVRDPSRVAPTLERQDYGQSAKAAAVFDSVIGSMRSPGPQEWQNPADNALAQRQETAAVAAPQTEVETKVATKEDSKKKFKILAAAVVAIAGAWMTLAPMLAPAPVPSAPVLPASPVTAPSAAPGADLAPSSPLVSPAGIPTPAPGMPLDIQVGTAAQQAAIVQQEAAAELPWPSKVCSSLPNDWYKQECADVGASRYFKCTPNGVRTNLAIAGCETY